MPQAIINSKLIQIKKLQEMINELTSEVTVLESLDPYAELKIAFAKGAEIAHSVKGKDQWTTNRNPQWNKEFDYKIVDRDQFCTEQFYLPEFNEMVKLEFTRSGLTGKTSNVRMVLE